MVFPEMKQVVRLVLVFPIVAALTASCAPVKPRTEWVRVRPKTHDRHLRNPGMGLIIYGRPDPPPPEADIYYNTIVWHDVETEPGVYNWQTQRVKRLFEVARKHNRRVALRLVTSWQNYDNPLPDYLTKQGVKLFPHGRRPKSFRVFMEPEWWNPKYIRAYKNLVHAFGREFDGHPMIDWIDMRYYGFWGEGHRYHQTVPWPKDVDKRELLKQFIDVHFEAFKKTPMVIQTASDYRTKYPEGTAIDYGLSKGAWMRRDGFGPFINAQEDKLMKSHWKTSLMIAENGGSLRDYLAGKVRKEWIKDSKPISIDFLFDQMFEFHVNYFPLGWGIQDYRALKEQRPDLLRKASLKTGYRMVVTEAAWPATARPGETITVKTVWRNIAVGRLPFRYRPTVCRIDPAGKVTDQAAADADATKWYENEDHDVEFRLKISSAAPPGVHGIAVALVRDTDKSQVPAIALGIEGEIAPRVYKLGTITIERRGRH